MDSRGSSCPGPITDLFRAYRQANLGDVIELLATDPAAESDVKAWAAKTGNRVVEAAQEGGYVRLVIQVERKGR